MSLNELLPSVQELPHEDKLKLMQCLAAQLAKEEGVPLLSPDVEYPVWSPYDAHEAAAMLSVFLEDVRISLRLAGQFLKNQATA